MPAARRRRVALAHQLRPPVVVQVQNPGVVERLARVPGPAVPTEETHGRLLQQRKRVVGALRGHVRRLVGKVHAAETLGNHVHQVRVETRRSTSVSGSFRCCRTSTGSSVHLGFERVPPGLGLLAPRDFAASRAGRRRRHFRLPRRSRRTPRDVKEAQLAALAHHQLGGGAATSQNRRLRRGRDRTVLNESSHTPVVGALLPRERRLELNPLPLHSLRVEDPTVIQTLVRGGRVDTSEHNHFVAVAGRGVQCSRWRDSRGGVQFNHGPLVIPLRHQPEEVQVAVRTGVALIVPPSVHTAV
mmetsp:Transcript_19765/g.49727  ORF Transcript_19765/g.49727 Transcript_19765/m.49727 type:complete len:300 (-) Transcript_19765:312-1211(-)